MCVMVPKSIGQFLKCSRMTMFLLYFLYKYEYEYRDNILSKILISSSFSLSYLVSLLHGVDI